MKRWVWLVTLAIALLFTGLAWAVSSPVGSSPDDDFHLGSIWCGALAPDELCATVETGHDAPTLPPGVRSVLVPSQIGPPAFCFAFDRTISAACQLGGTSVDLVVSRANDGLYPGGYYAIMGILVTDSPARSVIAMRVATFVLCVGLILGAVQMVTPTVRRSYILAALATAIPLAVFLFSSTNPSGVVVAAIGVVFVSAIGFLGASSSGGMYMCAGLGVVAGVAALWSRADAGYYLAAVSACALILDGDWRGQARSRSMFVAAVGAVGLAWLLFWGQTSEVVDGMVTVPGELPLGAVVWTNLTDLPSLWAGALGISWGLGWLDTRMPDLVGVGMVFGVSGLAFWGLGETSRRKLLAVIAGMLAVTVAPLWVLTADRLLVGQIVQPRYLLPMLPVILTLCLLPTQAEQRRLNDVQLALLGVIWAMANSVALHANIKRYVTGQDVYDINLNADAEWWWSIGPSPMVVWIVGSVAFAIAVAVSLFKGVREGTPEPEVVPPHS